MTSKSLIAAAVSALLLCSVPAAAQASCSAAAAKVASQPNTRVVSVKAKGKSCRIRVIIQAPGQVPRSKVIVVRR